MTVIQQSVYRRNERSCSTLMTLGIQTNQQACAHACRYSRAAAADMSQCRSAEMPGPVTVQAHLANQPLSVESSFFNTMASNADSARDTRMMTARA